MACNTSSRVIAGSCAKLRVPPRRIAASMNPAAAGDALATPASTTSSVMPATFDNALIAGKHDNRRPLDTWPQRPLNQPDLKPERFEPPETAGRFCLRIDHMLQFGRHRSIERFRTGKCVVHSVVRGEVERITGTSAS